MKFEGWINKLFVNYLIFAIDNLHDS